MPMYRRVSKFSLLMHVLIFHTLCHQLLSSYSVLLSVKETAVLAQKATPRIICKTSCNNIKLRRNITFALNLSCYFIIAQILAWLIILLLILSGNIHPNPGPLSEMSSNRSSSSDSSINLSTSVLNSLDVSHHLSFVHYNVQSILTKLDILHTELFEFDILAFSETWLSPTTPTGDLILQSYNSERRDRVGDRYGGLIIYIKEGLHYRRRKDLEPLHTECIWIEVSNSQKHILFGLFYRPPNADSIYYSSIEDSLNLAVDTEIQDIIVTGDFNFNIFNQQTSRKIESLCNQFALYQSIDEPTHFTETSSSLLDIILVSNKDHLLLSGVADPFLNQEVRYHCPVYGIFKFSKPKQKSFTRHIWKYFQGDYDLLRTKAASTDWTSLYDDDISTHAENITSHIISIAKECIPNKTIRIRPSDPPWITSYIKHYIRKRKRAYRKAKRTSSSIMWTKFRKLRNKVVALIRDSKNSFYDGISNKLKSNNLTSRDWWTVLKKVISPTSSSVIPPLESNGSIFTEELDKANILNQFFQSQTFLNEQNATLPALIPYETNSNLSSINLTPVEVHSILSQLPLGKATGPNGLSNRILKELATELSEPLCSLYNMSLRTGTVPSSYKKGNVCAVFKKDDPTLPSNYRPITLLNSEDKVFERLIFKHLYNHLHDNNILTPLQSGFIPGDSTVNQLTYLYNTFCQALDSGKEVRVVFCDISKAFDRVWHVGLIHKLRSAGVTGKILDWFKSYLTDRQQRVVLPGVASDWAYIRAGVPQGSVLGPLLFLLYINDIVNDIGANIRLFADDTSLFIIVENPVTAAVSLNADLSRISNWANTWLVTFNPNKTESLLLSRKLTRPVHPPIYMQNQQISEVETHKHLGIFISNDCTWHTHIDYIKNKAWNRIHIMRKLKFKIDRKSLEIIYTSFIRPILEYADVIWDNCTQYEKQELEKIQNEAARIAIGATKLISLDKLYSEIKWDSLEKRRKDHKLTLFYKMQINMTPSYLSNLIPQTIGNISQYNLRNSDNLQTINARTSQYANSFLPSTVRDWNSLPPEIAQSDSLTTFKNHLNRNRVPVPKHYYSGSRQSQILHTRLRTNCSSLNNDLFLKNITDSPLCGCGSIENTKHFFLQCPFYCEQRADLLASLSQFGIISLNLLLYGDNSLSLNTNVMIFERVHKYIRDTKRF